MPKPLTQSERSEVAAAIRERIDRLQALYQNHQAEAGTIEDRIHVLRLAFDKLELCR